MKPKGKKCVWKRKIFWFTGCGYAFRKSEKEHFDIVNLFKFCPYCGSKIEVR